MDPYLNKNYTGLYAGARQSRLGMETSINSKIGLIRTYIEGDYAGSKYPLAFKYFWRRNWSFSAITGMVYLWYPRDHPMIHSDRVTREV